ncbi:FecR family protein [Fulvitalea axinellae]|uniref:FecR family protein n=1 Tax=Fulvitalea axinellae TaxID=1182444 RepID=UPI0030CA39C9
MEQNPTRREIAEVWVSVSAPRGTTKTVQLPDGTRIRLNADTKLEYLQGFSQRRVRLVNGEAYFDVAKDSLRPFSLKITESGRLRVLGTAFNVRAYSDDPVVSLVHGRVAVGSFSDGRETILDPMRQISLASGAEVRRFNLRSVTGWKDGDLYYEDKPLEKVLEDLERTYDAEFLKNPEFDGKKLYTGSLLIKKHLDNVLVGLSYTTGLTFERLGDKRFRVK